jgi:signal transduction histidine kinase
MGVGRDLWAMSKTGKQIPVEVGLNPIQGESERTVLASIVDISGRARIESERRRLLLEAQQAVEARDAFLSIASHELKTPLTALQLTTQALLRACGMGQRQILADAQVRDRLTAATRQVSRLGKLVDQLLDVSRLTSGPLVLERERVDLTEIVDEVVQRFVQNSPACGIRWARPEPIWGEWDGARLDQVFTNLLGNAVKYGEGKPIEVVVEDGPHAVGVAIIDQGPGIAPSDQARIFERFERLVSHRQFGGFGLGLWIVRQLVEAHGGTIEVTSRPAKGSTFRVRVPK